MQFKQHQLDYREGLILQLQDSNGEQYFVEFAPLPGFSQETFFDVKKQLIALLSTSLDNLHICKPLYPCIQFAFDYLPVRGVDEKKIQRPSQQQPVIIDNIPLLQGNKTQVIMQYQSLNQPAIIKLKVARGLVSEDIESFQALCGLNPKLKIRCDANQAWDEQQAASFFSHINIDQLEYIEEPTNDHQLNLQLAEQFYAPLGLDETLQQTDFKYKHNPFIHAFIIKPTIIGNKQKIDQLVSIAQKHNITVSFSSSFESVIGLQQLKRLAAHYSMSEKKERQPTITLGIDTLKYFNSVLLMDKKKIAEDCKRLEILWTSKR